MLRQRKGIRKPYRYACRILPAEYKQIIVYIRDTKVMDARSSLSPLVGEGGGREKERVVKIITMGRHHDMSGAPYMRHDFGLSLHIQLRYV